MQLRIKGDSDPSAVFGWELYTQERIATVG